MRWKPGVGRCQPPGWIRSAGVYEGDIFQASAGCIPVGGLLGGATLGHSVIRRSPPQGPGDVLMSPPPNSIQGPGSSSRPRVLKPSLAPSILKPSSKAASPPMRGAPKTPQPLKEISSRGGGEHGNTAARLHAFTKRWPAIPGYPGDVPCQAALPPGGRCVLGQARAACQAGLVCFQWKAGHGQCRLPAWLGTAGVSTGDVYQASFGCKSPKRRRGIE